MGTSKSSAGSPSNVPMVPPWVPDIEPPEQPTEPNAPNEEVESEETPPAQTIVDSPIAPSGRFRSTRISLGDFGSSGSRQSMQRGVGRYIKNGLGGSQTAARRFGGTAKTARTLYGVLGGDGAQENRSALDRDILGNQSARKIIDAIIEVACPVDGSQDTEASRTSINDALTELLKRFPDADLFQLTEDQRELVIDYFVSMDVYRRFVLDVGGAVREKAPNHSTALSRLKQVREYIREHVTASFQRIRDNGTRLRGSHVTRVVNQALQDAFDVFSGFSE